MYFSNLATADPHISLGHPCHGCTVRDTALCNTLTQVELADYRRNGVTRKLSPGQALCWEGDAVTHVYTLTHGALRLSRHLPDGRRQVTGFAFPGDFIGLTLEEEHPFTAEAIGSAELCQFGRARFDAFVSAHPQMQKGLYAAAARELAVVREQVVLLGRKTASERLASFLLDMANHSEQFPSEPRRVALPMSRMDMADYLGLRIETVSRELGALKAAGLIRMLGVHELYILDPVALRNSAYRWEMSDVKFARARA